MIKRILVALDPDEAAPTVRPETKSLRGGMYMTKTGKIIGIGGVGLLMTGYLLWARTTDRRETQRLWHGARSVY